MSQYESTQPREFSAFWSAPASYGRGTYYNRVTVYCKEIRPFNLNRELAVQQSDGILYGEGPSQEEINV